MYSKENSNEMRKPISESQKSSINFRYPKTKLIKFFLTNMMRQRLCYLDYWLIEVMLGEGEDFTFYFLIIIDSLLLHTLYDRMQQCGPQFSARNMDEKYLTLGKFVLINEEE